MRKSNILSLNIPLNAITRGPKHHFFGYYDKCPWDSTGRYVLAMETDFINRFPGPNDSAVIGLIDLKRGCHFEPIAETRAWNWQQGAMLQWVPSFSDRLIIFNDRKEGQFISVLVDIHTGKRATLPRPIYTLSHDGRFALSVNFSRLHHVGLGYGYPGVTDPRNEHLYPDDDGIYLMDLSTGVHQLILSFAQVADFRHHRGMEYGMHWFDLLMINPEDTRFCFLHRWRLPDGGIYTRLFTANLDGSDLYCLLDSGYVSHLDWYDSRRILAWARQSNTLAWARQRGLFDCLLLRKILSIIRRYGMPGWFSHRILDDGYLLLSDRASDAEPVGKVSYCKTVTVHVLLTRSGFLLICGTSVNSFFIVLKTND